MLQFGFITSLVVSFFLGIWFQNVYYQLNHNSTASTCSWSLFSNLYGLLVIKWAVLSVVIALSWQRMLLCLEFHQKSCIPLSVSLLISSRSNLDRHLSYRLLSKFFSMPLCIGYSKQDTVSLSIYDCHTYAQLVDWFLFLWLQRQVLFMYACSFIHVCV